MSEPAAITFDAIHTRKKQENLARMMAETAAAVLQIGNDQPRSDHCPICQGRELHHFTEKFGFHLDRCGHRHHLFCNPMPRRTELHSSPPNSSLDVSYVRKLLAAGDPGHRANAGHFIAERIHDDDFAAALARLLVETRQAGNILVIAQRPGEVAHV